MDVLHGRTDDRPGGGGGGPTDYGAMLRSAKALLDHVDRALAQLAEGSYGRCAVCGAPIDDGMLAQDPTAQGCVQHCAPDVAG